MFKNVLSYAVATSILLTSFEGVAVKGKVSSQDDRGQGKAKQALLVHQAPFQIAPSSLALYDAITTSGPSFLRRSLVADLQIQYEKSGRKLSGEKLKIDRDGLNSFPNSSMLYESYGDNICFEVSREDIEGRVRNIENFLKEDPMIRGKLIEQCFDDPRRLVKSLQLNFGRWHTFEKAWKERIDKVSSFLDKTRNTQTWPLDVERNIRWARSILLHLIHEKQHVIVGGALGTLYLKSSLPFVMLCSQMMTLDPEENINKTIEESLIIIKRDFEINLLIKNFQKQIEMYKLLTFEGTLFREDMCEIYNGFISNLECDFREKCSENTNFFKIQDNQVQRAVDNYRQQKTEEVMRLVTQMQQCETERNVVDAEKKASKGKRKTNLGPLVAQAVKQEANVREAETLRLQQQLAQAQASTSSTTPPKVKAPRDMSPEGQLMHWFFESNENFNKRKETQQKLAILIAAQQRKAHAKAAKNHDINPERVQSTSSLSSSSSTSSSSTSSSSSSSTSSASAAAAPAAGTQYRAILGSNHYKTLESLLTDKTSGKKMETVKALFEALGGYVDDFSHSGSRVGMGLRHIDTGKAALLEVEYDGDEEEDNQSVLSSSSSSSGTTSTSSSTNSSSSSSSTAEVRMVMHGTHARGKNGRKGLRPEQILDIREMLITVGYTLETVISKADVSTEAANTE